jgi:tripartite-type tricarboxylate transporter receptor subunit TctC
MSLTLNLNRRKFLAGLGAIVLAPGDARAELPYPGGRTIKVVVSYAPGGTSDVVGRLVADRLATKWGVPVVVENVAGANGNLGNERVAKGTADGTQLLIVTANFVTNEFLYPRLTYDPGRDFMPISCVARLPNLLVVRKDLPVKSVGDLIAYGKDNPGKLSYGSPGSGSTPHLSAEIFKLMTGIQVTAVGYRGSGPALNDLVAGNIDLMFDNITAAINLVRGGQLKGLAVTSAQRTPLAPEFPPIAETVQGFDVSTFHGVGIRAGTPSDIVSKIEKDVIALTTEPAVRERLSNLVAETVGSTSAEFTRFLVTERERWRKIIKELSIRIE